MRRHHDSVHTRPQRSRRLVIHRGNHLHADDPLLLLRNLDGFDTIKKPTQADDAAHVVPALPLTAKASLHDEHYQNEQDMYRIPVELERKANRTFHRSTFPAPNVLALGAYCVERSRTPESRSALPSAINVIRQIEALPVYRSGWGLSGLTLTLNERTPPIPQLVTGVA